LAQTQWPGELEPVDSITGDRRRDRRYRINLELRWKLIRRRRVLDAGVGQTLDLSSGGIRFDAGRQLPVGLNVELAIAWPVLLRNETSMQLIVSGRIVRVGQNGTAVAMVQHEFRTTGTIANPKHKKGPSSPAPSILLPGGSGATPFAKYRH
jgi:hypothetical protein